MADSYEIYTTITGVLTFVGPIIGLIIVALVIDKLRKQKKAIIFEIIKGVLRTNWVQNSPMTVVYSPPIRYFIILYRLSGNVILIPSNISKSVITN